MNSILAELGKLNKFYSNYIQSSGGNTAAAGEESTGEDTSPLAAETVSAGVNLATLRPATRADALLMLRKGAEYFQRQEPNSPIPLLVNRALRISEMNFIDLLQDIVPDALDQGKKILGVRESES